jgi:cell division transport system ATP-binding protein
MEIFKSFHQVGATLLISTHDESILRNYKGRSLALKQGELQA